MSFEPVKCPPKCVYSMLMCGGGEKAEHHCGYLLITGEMRGCDPGPGCKRYVKGKRLPASPEGKRGGKKFSWDEPKGREMWKQGKTDREIADALGVRRQVICDTRNRKWRKGK